MPSISYPRSVALALIALMSVVGLTACDPTNPAHVQAWYDLNPEQGRNVTAETMNEPQRAVIAHLRERQRAWEAAQAQPVDCYTAMERVWPAHLWATGRRVIHRESRNDPGAQNRSSSAAGCWQMLRMHAHRFDAVGCSWAQRYDAMCNTRAAWRLWQDAGGWSPWSLTAH